MANRAPAPTEPIAGRRAGTDEQAARLLTPAFVLLTLAELAYFTAAGLTIPITPLFAHGPLGAGEASVGLAVGAFSITALLLRPYAGRLTDRVGRPPLLVGGALVGAAALAAHPLAADIGQLIALRLVLGVAEAFFFVASFAAVADLAPAGRTGEALSFNSLAIYLGVALGPLAGQVLLDLGGFAVAWLGGAGLSVVAAILAARLPETARPSAGPTPAAPLVHRAAIAPSLALFTGMAGMAGFFAFVAIYATNDLGLAGAGWVLLEFGLLVVATRIVFARLPDRVPPFRLGAIALGLTGLGLLVMGVIPTVVGLGAGTAILAVGVAFTTPALFAATFARVEASQRGAASGTASLFIDLGFGGGPMALGLVAGASGIPVAFAAAAGLAGLGAAGSAVLAARGGPAALANPAPSAEPA